MTAAAVSGVVRTGERSRSSQFRFRSDSKHTYRLTMKFLVNISFLAVFLIISTISISGSLAYITTCNEAICGPIVSKCGLLKSCECKINDSEYANCIKRCYSCLDYLQADCCSCFDGICRTSNETEVTNSLAKKAKSLIGEIGRPENILWDALMKGDDPSTQ